MGSSLVYLRAVADRPSDGEFVEGGIEAKTHRVLMNIKEIVEAAGAGLRNVIKTTIFLMDMNHFSDVNKVYSKYFNAAFPARSTVLVSVLPKGAEIEVEVSFVYLIKKIGLKPMKKGGNNATEEENQLFLDGCRDGYGPSYFCLRIRSCRKE